MSENSTFSYIGQELSLFAQAHNWHHYYRRTVRPYVGRKVLEVGCGHGTITSRFCTSSEDFDDWLCIDPDPEHAAIVERKIRASELPTCCRAFAGTLASLPDQGHFDTLIYTDVLEHIVEDRAEMQRAAERLKPGGYLIVLCPAFNMLFSKRDTLVGHVRRYTKKTLRATLPTSLREVQCRYLDSLGAATSLANRLWLNQGEASAKQIQFWDGVLVPLSRILDPLIAYSFGRSVLLVAQRHA